MNLGIFAEMVNFAFIKPEKDEEPKETVTNLMKLHRKARRNLSDTLSKTGQFELKEIKRQMAEMERNAKKGE